MQSARGGGDDDELKADEPEALGDDAEEKKGDDEEAVPEAQEIKDQMA